MGRVPRAWEIDLLLVQPTSSRSLWSEVVATESLSAETFATSILLALLLFYRVCSTGPGISFGLLCSQRGFPNKEHTHDTYEGMDLKAWVQTLAVPFTSS